MKDDVSVLGSLAFRHCYSLFIIQISFVKEYLAPPEGLIT